MDDTQTTVAFEPIEVPRVADRIVAQIEELILEGTLKPDERLPPERELAQTLGVSRPSLREAIVQLEAKGLIKVRRGGGTYVCDAAARTITDPLDELLKSHPDATMDVLELRRALEGVSAYYAAIRCNDSDREILRRRFEDLETEASTVDPSEAARADVEFHMSVADASHNVALVQVMRGMFSLLHDSITENLARLRAEPVSYKRVHQQHEEIYRAILAGKPDAAREAADTHLAFVAASLKALEKEGVREQRSRRRLNALGD